jgi:hypothetical protein
MLGKIHSPKGLNLRQSAINADSNYARDVRNIEHTGNGDLILRWGYDKVLTEAGILDLFEYVGKEGRNGLYALKADGLYSWNGTALIPVRLGNLSTIGDAPSASPTQPTWSVQTKPVEYNRCLYWTDPTFGTYLWKYDGHYSYRAGVQKPQVTTAAGSGSNYFRVMIGFRDIQGNVTYGDYEEFALNTATPTFSFTSITNNYYSGFYSKITQISAFDIGVGAGFILKPSSLLDKNNRTIPIANVLSNTLATGYAEGDTILVEVVDTFDNVSGTTALQSGVFKPVVIETIDGSGITITADSIGEDIITFASGPLSANYEILIARSTNPINGFVVTGGFNPYLLNYETGATVSIAVAGDTPTNLREIYDDSLVRVLPPKMKYITLFNELMVGASVSIDTPDFGIVATLGNDTRLQDSIVWSDIPTVTNGSSIETFLVNNVAPVGATQDGEIVAVFGNDDNLVVHKQKQSFFVNGDFITNTLRVRKAMTEQVGGASHRSIKEVEGGHLYTSPKGVYLVAGGDKPVELSDMIEPLFNENALGLAALDLTAAKSINDFLREKIYIFIPYQVADSGICLVYDYYYKDWWVHDNIPAKRGFQDVGISSSEVYMADSTGLYKRNLTVKRDAGVKIAGYYTTSWFDISLPSIRKMFNNFILLSIGSVSWIATVKAYCNWDDSVVEGQTDIGFNQSPNNVKIDEFNGPIAEANSVSYKISNGTTGNDILISGYEIEYEDTQQEPKGFQ